MLSFWFRLPMNTIIKKQKVKILLFLFLSIFLSLIEVSFAEIITLFIDSISKHETKILLYVILAFIVFIISNFTINLVTTTVKTQILKNIHIESKNRIMNTILNMSSEDFNQTTLGDKINIFEYNLSLYEQYYLESFFLIIQSVVVLLIVSLYLVSINPSIFIAMLVSSIAVPIISLFAGRKIDTLTQKNAKLKGEYLQTVKEILSGFFVIKSFNSGEKFAKKFSNSLRNLENNVQKLTIKNTQFSQILGSTQYFTIIICFCLGGWLVLNDNLTLGKLIAVTQISNMVIQPIQLIGTSFIEMKGSVSVRENLEKYLINENANKNEVPFITEDIDCISLNNVSLRDGTTTILDEVSMTFKMGGKYAIVGKSGSGKSSILSILGLLATQYSGNMLINHKDVKQCMDYFQNNVALVQQENFIFQDTVKNNITMYSDYSSKAIQGVMNYCCFGDNLTAETFLTEGGRDISGGEKQRIALARAKIKNSPLILLDEFNSAFDEISKQQIVPKLLAEEKKIIIFVTHDLRKEFLEKMDNIYLIDSGKIAEEGNFSELLRKHGSFYDLYNGIKSEV